MLMRLDADADGEPRPAVGTVTEEMLRAIVDEAVDAILVIDEEGRVQMANPATERLFGYPLEGLLGTKVNVLMPEPHRTFHDDYLRHFRETGERRIIGIGREVSGRRSDGSVFPMYLSVSQVRDGTRRFFAGIVHDLSAQKRIENALRESRRSLDTLMSNVPGMVYRCRNDRDWTMEFVSGGGTQFTGFLPAELMAAGPRADGGIGFATLIHPEDRDIVWDDIQAALVEGRPYEITYRLRSKTGEEKWVWDHGRGVHADNGRLLAREGLILDVSARRQTELALSALAGSAALDSGRDFIRSCVRELARTYGARYAFVGVFADARKQSIRTLAVWAGDGFADNFTYDLAGTPCQDILRCRTEIVPRGVADRYPRDRLLRTMGVESYFGTPLVNSEKETVGLVSVMDTRPMRPNVWTRSILGVFGYRIALELEREQAEERLRESEAYMRLTLENSPIGIASADLEGRLLDVNPAFAALLGYRREEVIGKRVRDITHPDDREETRRHFEALVRGDIPRYELEKRYIRKDGSAIHVRAQAGLVRDAAGRPVRVIGEVEDETERREAARELKRMRGYLKDMIDSMPSVLIGVDLHGRVTEWNRSAERSTGIAAEAAVGRDFELLVPQLAGQMHNVTQAIRHNQPVRTERLAVKRNGETRYAEVMVYPLLANGDQGAVIRMDDITERIRIEQMMVQTEKMLSVGGLAAGMAHEISNPLSIVMQSAQNVKRRLSTELPANRTLADALGLDLDVLGQYLEGRGVSGFIEGIQEAGARASRIVADMLAFSRRSGGSELTENRLDEMLDTAVRLAGSDYDLKKKYDFRQIEILRDFDPGLGAVKCDRTQIEQVFLNLLKNAAHAMSDADTPLPRRIRLRTWREDGLACIEVEDNGPGMDEATRNRAFEPFFTTKEVGVGTGLGLSVSYFIITEQHKGSISVASRPGDGCRFTIRLPIQSLGGGNP